jgi:asparagine synthase (glutamine-hydrolysing)
MLAAQAPYAPAEPVQISTAEIALGRRLFSLLPEDRFDLGPVTGGDGRWTLVADVRLDNRAELAEALGIAPAPAAGLADAALVMRAVERWQEKAIARLIGDFALALWDGRERRLILARDFLGSRPLHFHRHAGRFAFASTAKGLHALDDVPRAPDEEALAQFLALVPRHGTNTYFIGIERVPPGHLCVVTGTGVETRRFWSPERATLRLRDDREYDEAVREQLERAVAVRLRGAGGTLATQLSGGLDSAAVTAAAARQRAPDGQIVAFTSVPRTGFSDCSRRGRFTDEGAHAAAVAALYPNVEHVPVRTEGESPLAALDDLAFFHEEPVLNLCNAVWIDRINRAAQARGARVLLTGQMGNVTISFPGFERLPALVRNGRLVQLVREAARLRRNGMRAESIAAHAFGPFLPLGLWAAINRWRGRVGVLEDYSLIAPAAAERVRGGSAAAGMDVHYRPSADAFAMRLSALGRIDPGNYNKGTLARWGLDLRDPTADRRLVELCLAIPVERYLRRGRTRAVARDAFAEWLPPAVAEETQKGLQAADWYEGLCADRAGAGEEVERLATIPQAVRILDIARMRRLVAQWPEKDWNSPRIEGAYRFALLRGLSAGHFLRKALGSD